MRVEQEVRAREEDAKRASEDRASLQAQLDTFKEEVRKSTEQRDDLRHHLSRHVHQELHQRRKRESRMRRLHQLRSR